MKSRVFIVVAILSAFVVGCKEHLLPAIHGHLLEPGLASDMHEIPPGRYDGLFQCSQIIGNNEDMYDAAAEFFDDSGKAIRPQSDLHVTVNGDTVRILGGNRVRVKYPEPITWKIDGNARYLSVTHVLPSDSSIAFLSPDSIENKSIYSGFEVRYHAPQDIDSIGLLISYQGQGIYKRDTMNRIKRTGQDFWERARNTGRYFVRPFSMDSLAFRRFDPQKLLVLIRWVKGDTAHVGPFVYGFVTESHSVREFKLKN